MLAHLKGNLHQAQNHMKQQADQHRSKHKFQEGDQCIGEVAYKLALPPTTKIHPVFHISCLKKVVGNHRSIQTCLPKLDEEDSLCLQPEQVLDTQEQHLCGHMIKEVLVKWKDTSPEDATWETTTTLQQFCSFNLEDKAIFMGEVNLGSNPNPLIYAIRSSHSYS
eukprot:PITA_01439